MSSKPNPVRRLTEVEIKALTLSVLRHDEFIRPSDIIASELPLGGASRRIDLAILSDDFLGVEIKSEFDNLRRLSGQVDGYLRYFDAVYLVVAERHMRPVIETIPDIVGLFVVSSDGILRQEREAVSTSGLYSSDLVRLMTKEEICKLLLQDINLTAKSRREMVQAASELPPTEIRKALRTAFQLRYGKTTGEFWKSVKAVQIEAHHLEKLSRFSGRRRQFQSGRRREEQFWQKWNANAAQFFTEYRASSCV